MGVSDIIKKVPIYIIEMEKLHLKAEELVLSLMSVIQSIIFVILCMLL